MLQELLMGHVGEDVHGTREFSGVEVQVVCYMIESLDFLVGQIDVNDCIQNAAIGFRIWNFVLRKSGDGVFFFVNGQILADREISLVERVLFELDVHILLM